VLKVKESEECSERDSTRYRYIKEKQLARLPTYLLYLFSPLQQNGDKHRRDVCKSNLDVGRPHELHAQEVIIVTACHMDNLGRKLLHELIAEKILGCLR
jgi:hypothetical protein